MTELTISTTEYNLEPSKAKQIEAIFIPMVQMLKGLEGTYNEIVSCPEITSELTANARKLRLEISKVRISADKAHKAAKEESLRVGKAIDGVRNIIKYAVLDKETKLKEIEDYYENLEREELATIQREREALLVEYEVDGSQMDLSGMEDLVWGNFLEGSKANYHMRLEAIRKAEEDRLQKEIAYAEEQKRIREENAKLKAEQAENEKQRLIEEKQRAKEREVYETKLKAEQAEREKLEEEKAEIEKIKQSELQKQLYLKQAPDREKLHGFLEELNTISIPILSDNKIKYIEIKIREKLSEINQIINKLEGIQWLNYTKSIEKSKI